MDAAVDAAVFQKPLVKLQLVGFLLDLLAMLRVAPLRAEADDAAQRYHLMTDQAEPASASVAPRTYFAGDEVMQAHLGSPCR
jgi:hypothetical protein